MARLPVAEIDSPTTSTAAATGPHLFMAALRVSVPGDGRPYALLDQLCDLPGLGVALQLCLAEEQLIVELDLESPPRRRDQLNLGNHRRPFLEQLVRQTDGSWYVVSRDAELDGKAMLGVDCHL